MTTHIPLYPLPSKDVLYEKYVGKSLKDVETPAAIIDLSIVKRNCQKMLDAVNELGFGWRAHIKTHKVGSISHSALFYYFFNAFHSLECHVAEVFSSKCHQNR